MLVPVGDCAPPPIALDKLCCTLARTEQHLAKATLDPIFREAKGGDILLCACAGCVASGGHSRMAAVAIL